MNKIQYLAIVQILCAVVAFAAYFLYLFMSPSGQYYPSTDTKGAMAGLILVLVIIPILIAMTAVSCYLAGRQGTNAPTIPTTPEAVKGRFCSACGQELRSGQGFCDKCGAKQ